MDTQKIKEYLYGNLASIFWSLFLLIGGGIFISYYAHIGYMPDFDFKSSITLLSAASVTAMVIVLLFLSILIFPGVYWTNWANTTQLKRYWEDNEGNKKLLKTTLYFGAPIIFFYGLFFILYQYRFFAIPYTATGIAFCYKLLSKTGLHEKELWKELGGIASTSLICSILTLFPIYVVSSLAASTPITPKGDPIFIGLVVALFIAFANIMAVAKPPKINGFLWYSGLGFMTFFVLVSSFEITHRIPERVMEIYKFGSIHTKLIVFKSDGCETLNILGINVSSENNKQCSLSGVNILSRLGKEMYLEKDNLKFTINSTEIVSWSVNETSDNKIKSTAKNS